MKPGDVVRHRWSDGHSAPCVIRSVDGDRYWLRFWTCSVLQEARADELTLISAVDQMAGVARGEESMVETVRLARIFSDARCR